MARDLLGMSGTGFPAGKGVCCTNTRILQPSRVYTDLSIKPVKTKFRTNTSFRLIGFAGNSGFGL